MNFRRMFAALLLFMVTPSLFAFCYEPKIRLDDEFFISDFVVTATLVGDKKLDLDKDGFYTSDLFTWRVRRVYRGAIKFGDTFLTSSGNDSGRYPFVAVGGHLIGQTYVLFVGGTVYAGETKKTLYVDNCGNSRQLSSATNVLRQITQIGKSFDGIVYGCLLWQGNTQYPVVAKISIQNDVRQYTATATKDGVFAKHVAPGIYRILVTAPGFKIEKYELSYKDPEKLSVPSGGSAGVAFHIERADAP
jgi:hypothetical protein